MNQKDLRFGDELRFEIMIQKNLYTRNGIWHLRYESRFACH